MGPSQLLMKKDPLLFLLTLINVLHIPNISCNLKCQAKFFPSKCEFQDLNSGRMIGSARQSEGLYFFENQTNLKGQSHKTSFGTISISSKDEIMLWHFRLGHPNFQYLKHLFPNLFSNKDHFSFQCKVCELAKHHRASFPLQSYKPSELFSIIHNDLWDHLGLVHLLKKLVYHSYR